MLAIGLLGLRLLLSKQSKTSRSIGCGFECGYDVLTNARMGLSTHFYIIAIVFLIFDVEIALVLPLPLRRRWNSLSE